MFDFVRTHSKLMLGLMVLLIFPSFIFFGIQGYSRFTDGSAADVAKVDGRGITRGEWEAAHKRQVERMRQQMPGVDAKLLDTPEFKRQTLDALVQDYLLRSAALKLHLLPGDDRLARLFRTDPSLAGLRNADGTINRDLLAAQGMSAEGFIEQLRQDYGQRQVLGAVRASGFVPPAEANAALDAMLQRREIQFERFDPAAYAAKVNPSDAELQAYYKANEKSFIAPEQASIEYVLLDLDTIGRDISLPEAELRKYYEENIARYTAAEERRASHILIKADKDMPAAERAKAKARAEALLAEVRKAPASFAEVARKQSEDTGSAGQGGDLDFFARGAMVKPFEDAVFAMKVGEISPVIESDFGYHIITLTAVRGGEKKPFEQVRPEIEAEVRKSLAQKKYSEAAEQFSETVYQQYDSLQPVIDKLKLSKHTATVARAPAPGASGPLASEKLLAAVFGNEALKNKRNTDAVEVGPSQLASARVVKYEPAHALPLADVKDRVRAAVVAEQAAALARKDGEAKLTAARQSEAALPSTATVSRVQPQNLPRAVIDAVLRADLAKGPVAIGVDAGEQGYVVARVLKLQPREQPPGGDAPLKAQVDQAWAAAETEAYLEALKKRFKVEIKTAVVQQVMQGASAATP
ncbi:MAG: SurA N-terminal domain-containing protein [Proteobacteria bacterium]|nr:SurA N-terminal domain-containing protein [Pseudomonadota bacterium]